MKQTYISVKMVEAEEMRAVDFNELTNRMARDGEDPMELGYCVTYPDGYKGWCPAPQFEAANFPLASDNTIDPDDVDRFVVRLVSSKIGEKTAVAMVQCVTGFEIVETSACVDPNNFDQDVGAGLALESIKGKLWAYLGFVLQWAKNGIKKDN